MVAKISSGKSVFGVLNYNKIKVEDKQAEVLYRQKMFDSPDGSFSIADCMDSFYSYLANNRRTENVVFHASINPDPKDKLSDEQFSSVCQDYMQKLGYGDQPYIIFLHKDIDRTHAHIVSLRIDEEGKKISDKFENNRSMTICRDLEKKYKLCTPTKKEQRVNEIPTKKIDYRKGDIKHQVGNITKSIMNNFHFQSFGEYRTLLEMFNVTAEEVKGERNGKPYQGLIYSVIDDKGDKLGIPFKSSLFGKSVGFDALQKHYDESKLAVEKKKVRENLRPIISQAMKNISSIDDLKQSLLKQGIGTVFRQNAEGRIYGVSFIDYQNNTILNGSRLGKEFSANVFNDLLNNPSERNIQQTAVEKFSNETNRISQSAESIGVQQSTDLDSLGLLDFEQHGTDYEAEAFAREKENEERIRQRKKRRGRGRGRGM